MDSEYVRLMTVHAAKGLEFDTVFVTDMNEGIFPNERAMNESGTRGVEEERRLAYVAFTRARNKLYLTEAGGFSYILQRARTTSRFIREIDEEYIEHIGNDARFPEVPLERQTELVCEALSELLPEAEKCGITICIENIWFRINTPDMLLKIKSHFPTPNLGFCYDAGHANIMDKGRTYGTGNAWRGWNASGKPVPQWEDQALEKMLPHVVNCHLHDNDGSADSHNLPGCGNVKWDHIVDLLGQAPRLKVIQSEVKHSRHNLELPMLVQKFRQMFDQE
jgi:sugar phosphate isomerase/epimerase